MNESKADFCKHRIIELVDKVVTRESIPTNSESYADLGWIKFYVRELTTQCKDCAESDVSKKDISD